MPNNRSDITFSLNLLTRVLGKSGFKAMAVAALLVFATSFLTSQPPLIIGRLVNAATAGQGVAGAIPAASFLIGVIIAREALTVFQKYIIERASVEVQYRQFGELITKLFKLKVTALQDTRAGEIISRIDRSINGLTRLMKLALLDLLPSILASLFALGFAFLQNSLAGIVMFLTIFVSASVTGFQLYTQRGIRIDLQDSRASLAGKVGEMLVNLGFVRAAWLADREADRLTGDARHVSEVELRHHKAMMSFDAIKQLSEGFGLLAVIVIGLCAHGHHSASAGDVLALVLLYNRVSQPIQILHRVVDEGHESILAIAAIRNIYLLPDDPGLGGRTPPSYGGESPILAFHGLTVSFGSPNDEVVVLSDIELAIERGEVLGIVGPTGCGKSTLIKAALGLQTDFFGEVKVFGTQLRELNKELLAERICYLPQEPFIMAGTLRENLQIRGRQASDDELRQALSSASAAETTWALGLDTLIHEGGRNLSGGQRQRLSLARAFLSNADLYFVDEATSQLDAVTEERVTQALMLHCAGKTVITIAHRLKALAMVSRVLVLEHGKIVQDGPFESLAAQPGLFANLLRATDLDTDANRNKSDRRSGQDAAFELEVI